MTVAAAAKILEKPKLLAMAEENNVLAITQLLNSGVDVNLRNANGETALHVAARGADLEAVAALIAAGADSSKQTVLFNETALHYAVQSGHIATITLILDAGADVNCPDYNGDTPIFTAVKWSQVDAVPLLAARGADLNRRNLERLTPLAVAAGLQSPAVFQALDTAGASFAISGLTPAELEKWGKTPCRKNVVDQGATQALVSSTAVQQAVIANDVAALAKGFEASEELAMDAVYGGAAEVLDVILKAGVKPTPALFEVAIQEGQFDAFWSLLRAGADVNAADVEGSTPLFTAVKFGRLEITRALLKAGAVVNHVDLGGLTAIDYAVLGEYEFLFKVLLWHGAVINGTKFNPFHYLFLEASPLQSVVKEVVPDLSVKTWPGQDAYAAVAAKDCAKLKRILRFTDPNVTHATQGSLLHAAVRVDAPEVIRLLLKTGASANVRSPQDKGTPLHLALALKHTKSVDVLFGVTSMAIADTAGETPLFCAVRALNFGWVETAVRKGGNVNAVNAEGKTVLYVATVLKHEAIVRFLVGKGAKGVEVHPSLALAQDMKHAEVSKILTDGGAKAKGVRKARQLHTVESAKEREKCTETTPECSVCGKNLATQQLVPCGHIVACRGCVKTLIEDARPCPACRMKFIAAHDTGN